MPCCASRVAMLDAGMAVKDGDGDGCGEQAKLASGGLRKGREFERGIGNGIGWASARRGDSSGVPKPTLSDASLLPIRSTPKSQYAVPNLWRWARRLTASWMILYS